MRVTCKFSAILAATIGLVACGQEDRQEIEDRIAILEAENDRLRLDADNADVADERYDACLSEAYTAYDYRWQSSCSRLRDDDLRRRALCRSNGGSDGVCASIELRPARDCSLPSEIADSYEASYMEEKRLCMERLKIGR